MARVLRQGCTPGNKDRSEVYAKGNFGHHQVRFVIMILWLSHARPSLPFYGVQGWECLILLVRRVNGLSSPAVSLWKLLESSFSTSELKDS